MSFRFYFVPWNKFFLVALPLYLFIFVNTSQGVLASAGALGGTGYIPGSTSDFESRYPTAIRAREMTGDGILDYLVLTRSASDLALPPGYYTMNKNKMVYTSIFASTDIADEAEIADFNNDTYGDVVLLDKAGTKVSVFRNKTIEQVYTPATPPLTKDASLDLSSISDQIVDVKVADMNADGKLDILVISKRSLLYFKNTSGSTTLSFENAVNISATSVSSNLSFSRLCLFDVDKDGKTDALILAQPSSMPSVATFVYFRGDGAGALSFVGENATANSRNNFSDANIVVLDVNSDGQLDILMTGSSFSTDVEVYKNTSTQLATNISLLKTLNTDNGSNASVFNKTMALGDMNGDGVNDLVVGMVGAINPAVLLNQGGGTFAKQSSFLGYHSDFSGVVALGDHDADGDVDAVYATSFFNTSLSKYYVSIVPRYNLNISTSIAATCSSGDALLSASSYSTYSGSTEVLPNYQFRNSQGSLISKGTVSSAWVNGVTSSSKYYIDFVEKYRDSSFTVTIETSISASNVSKSSPSFTVYSSLEDCGNANKDLSKAIISSGGFLPSYYSDAKLTLTVSNPSSVGVGTYYLVIADGACTSVRPVSVINYGLGATKTINLIDLNGNQICAGTAFNATADGTFLSDHTYSWGVSSGYNAGIIQKLDGSSVTITFLDYFSSDKDLVVQLIDKFQSTSLECIMLSTVSIKVLATPKKPSFSTNISKDIADLYIEYTFTASDEDGTEYQWEINNNIVATRQPQTYVIAFSDLSLVNTEIGARVLATKNSNGCPSPYSDVYTFTLRPIPDAEVSYGDKSLYVYCDDLYTKVVTGNIDPNLTYEWFYHDENSTFDMTSPFSTAGSCNIDQLGAYKLRISRVIESVTYASEYVFDIMNNSSVTLTLPQVSISGGDPISLIDPKFGYVEKGSKLDFSVPEGYTESKWYLKDVLKSTDPTFVLYPEETLPYTLSGKNNFTCPYTMNITVTVLQSALASSTNLYTQLLKSETNVYAFDDVAKPLIFEIKDVTTTLKLSLVVMDRTGAIVYQSDDYNNDWSFIDKKTGNLLKEGTYFYNLEIKSSLDTNEYQPICSFFDVVR